MSLFISKATIQYHSNPSLCPKHWSQRCWSWMVLWRPTRLSRTNTKIRCPFHHRGLECKNRKSRVTWSNRQVWLGVQNEAEQRLTEICQENALVIANTLYQNTRDNSMYGHHQMVNTKIDLQPKMEKLYTFRKNKMRSWLWLGSWAPYSQIQT